MLAFEQKLWDEGMLFVAGVDEVGRGCLFGDVLAAAVILPVGYLNPSIHDSKKLTDNKRREAYEEIKNVAIEIGIGSVDAQMIDHMNIKQASRLAMRRAVESLKKVDYLLIDAETIESSVEQKAIIKGDALSQSIGAASIVAKVTRDNLCARWDEKYPGYGIAQHKGYATKFHREAIRSLGPTPMHRKTFLGNIVMQQEQLKLF